MRAPVIVVGAGMGGLTAAARLAQAGLPVLVLEARAEAGGLASGFKAGGLSFDAGPYILLDKPGLAWAFETLGADLPELIKVDEVYQMDAGDGPVGVFSDLDRTGDGFERIAAGSGRRYRRFVEDTAALYGRLNPLRLISRPSRVAVLRHAGLAGAWFLSRSLDSVLRATGLPFRVRQALAVWTHVAGQRVEEAPSPLAFVPALIHRAGAYYPREGIASVPEALERRARALGVEFRFGRRVKTIWTRDGVVRGVETADGDRIEARSVVANCSAVETYSRLLDSPPEAVAGRLRRLPLQSAGVAAYLAVKGRPAPPYLRFHLSGDPASCQLLVQPSVAAPDAETDGWHPARLLSPIDHAAVESSPVEAERRLEQLLSGSWWRSAFDEVRVLQTRTPRQWGAEFFLHRDSMNPVMTARFMRMGRVAHRSTSVRGLYLAGSSTHPGQWVSFCAISGILAAGFFA